MRAAIIGLGRTGMAHYRSYRVCGTEVVAVCGRTVESAKEKVEKLGISAVALTLEDLLARDDIDVVSICTPPECHAHQTILAAQAGKHIVIEKPAALSPQDLAAMREAIERAGVTTGTSFVWRWLPSVQAVLRRRSEIGGVIHARADFWNGRRRAPPPAGAPLMGTLERTGCHAVDMVVQAVGSRVSTVRALGTPQTIALLLGFENGSTASVTSSDEACRPLSFSLSVSGPSASLELNPDGSLFYAAEDYNRASLILPPRRDPYTFEVLPFTDMMREFLSAMRAGVDTSAGFPHTKHVHDICFAAERSAQSGGAAVSL